MSALNFNQALDAPSESSSAKASAYSEGDPRARAPIWWENATFFIGMHIIAFVGVTHLSPWHELDRRTGWMCFFSWQLAVFGITMGYHRLWSHKAFTASFALRVVLAGMGCLGFQGSIKWWVLRHRLHHRFTDTSSDPYNAMEGLFHSHMGWIFRKPIYPRMADIDKRDLEADPVVRFQHKHYIPLTLGLGLALPTAIGWTYGDAMGGYIWGGVVARIAIWHVTFAINSFAHFLGDQAYSEDVTARGNFLLAIFTGGEANHNYHHAFPSDYRNGPRWTDWDPTKWAIFLLHHFTPWVPKVRQTSEADILKARAHVLDTRAAKVSEAEATTSSSFARWGSFAQEASDDAGSSTSLSGGSGSDEVSSSPDSASGDEDPLLDGSLGSRSGLRHRASLQRSVKGKGKLAQWTESDLLERVTRLRVSSATAGAPAPLVLLLNGYAVDATDYANQHPGGVSLLRKYAVGTKGKVLDATEAFEGGLNNHGWSAREKVKELRIARIVA